MHALYLLILELRRVYEGVGRIVGECIGVEHVRTSHVGVVEVVESRTIVVLDGGGVIHPGAHIREADRLPIYSAMSGQQLTVK